jgi:hypothetical protein
VIELVSDNPNSERDHVLVTQRVQFALRAFAASVLRVCADGGEPFNILKQVIELYEALQEYVAEVGHAPTDDQVRAALKVLPYWQELRERFPTHDTLTDRQRQARQNARQDAEGEGDIITGALRIAAARLVNGASSVHETNARNEMEKGIKKQREAYEAEGRAIRSPLGFDPKEAKFHREWKANEEAKVRRDLELREQVAIVARELGVPEGTPTPWKKVAAALAKRGQLPIGIGGERINWATLRSWATKPPGAF